MIDRYSNSYMKEIFNEENRFQSFLKVEIATLEAFNKLGVVPLEDLNKIKENATFSLKRIKEIEEITHHDVIAFTRCVSESLGEERKWVHYGLTSTDVVDTANGIILKTANEYIDIAIDKFMETLKELALKYQNTPCIGRTHGIHAEITSFGLKFLSFYSEFKRNKERFNNARKRVECGKISGAVGNFANIDPFVEEYVCQSLGLSICEVSTQVLPRDLFSEYVYSLAQIATSLERIAMEVRSLQRSEVDEVSEYFSKGQKGSSAMPHKHNPIASENICGLARICKSYINASFDNNILWHERDISHSSSERIIFQDITTLIDYMLNRYNKVLKNLIVKEENIQKNILLTHEVIFSGRVVNALVVKGLSREEAYDKVQVLAFKAYEEKIPFSKLLKESSLASYFTNEEIIELFNPHFYLKNVSKIYERVLKK